MHLILPLLVAVGVAIWSYKTCRMKVFYAASLIAAILIGMEVNEKQ
jgi:hypothetical protein